MMKICCENFSLLIEPLVREVEGAGGPYLDWIKTEVRIQDGQFTGRVNWSVMPKQLADFRNQVSTMYDQILEAPSTPFQASLCGGWDEFVLTLEVAMPAGGIMASYTLHDAPDGPKLQGRFGLDQTFLPGIVKALDEILDMPATPVASLGD